MKSLTLVTILLIMNMGNAIALEKIALVIGVANYKYAEPLKEPINDAKSMDSVLTTMGYKVITLLDPSRKELAKGVKEFGNRMKEADICLFFFAGHGSQYNGENYLFSVNSKPTSPRNLPSQAFPLQAIINMYETSNIATSVMLLDASPNNSQTEKWKNKKGFKTGLASVNLRTRTFIGFSSAPGTTAAVINGQQNTFTTVMLKLIAERRTSLDDFFTEVIRQVKLKSNGLQTPTKSSALEDQVFLNGIARQIPLYPTIKTTRAFN